MGVQVDKLYQGISAEVVCPEQWAVVILQVRFSPEDQIKDGCILDRVTREVLNNLIFCNYCLITSSCKLSSGHLTSVVVSLSLLSYIFVFKSNTSDHQDPGRDGPHMSRHNQLGHGDYHRRRRLQLCHLQWRGTDVPP